MDYAQDTEDNSELNKSEKESITESDDDASKSSESSTKLSETADLEERTGALCNRQVAFDILASNNIPTDDINTISEENNIPGEEALAANGNDQ